MKRYEGGGETGVGSDPDLSPDTKSELGEENPGGRGRRRSKNHLNSDSTIRHT